jgi:endonuclease-8
VAQRCLREPTHVDDRCQPARTARRVVTIEESGEREESEILGEREPEREPPRRQVAPSAHFVERDAEERTVRRMEREAGRHPRARPRHELPEERDVGVVVAEEPAVEWLERRPEEGRPCSGDCTAAPAHSSSLPASSTVGTVPEGDSLHRAARRLQVLVGQRLSATSPHPRAQAERVAERIDGRVLESVEAIGKNLLFRFEGGVVLRSHLRMSGRWSVRPLGERRAGTPWLVLGGDRIEAVLWHGPVLELHTRNIARLGPDILERPPRIDDMLGRMRRADGTRWLGETLLDQSLVAGIGNMWLAEALWAAELSPWRRLREVSDDERRRALEVAAELMRQSVDGRRPAGHRVYRRVGRPCPRCGTTIRSWGQGDDNRMTYWCPGCQKGDDPRGA